MTSMADISREGIVLAGAGRALLLQLAHPAVGEGVVRHSDFAANPLGRLHGTLTFIFAVVSGTPEQAAAVTRWVDRAHVPVKGEGYDARDPGLQLWVAATLYDTAITVYERAFGPIPDEDAERIYRDYAVLGTALQLPVELWPVDRAAFRGYFDEQVARLAVSAEVRRVARQLFDPRIMPRAVRPLLPTIALVTAGLLPASVRPLFGMRFTAPIQRRFERAMARIIRVYKALPERARFAPQRYYLRRL